MSTKVLIIVIVAVLFVLGAMGGGFMLMWSKMNSTLVQVQSQNNAAEEEEKPPEEENGIGPIYKMDTLIVNLADQGGKRYLRVTMELELSATEVLDEIARRLPQLRNAILMVLPSKQYSDINTTQGKLALSEELMAKMNGILKSGTVKTIYFTEFVVQ